MHLQRDTHAQLTTHPIPSQSICDLSNMTEFHCTQNLLQHLPERIGDLKKLEILHCWDNLLLHWPKSFGQLDSLKEVHAYKNKMQWMPQSVGDLKSIEQLLFEGNKLKRLPQALTKLTTITRIGTRYNKLVRRGRGWCGGAQCGIGGIGGKIDVPTCSRNPTRSGKAAAETRRERIRGDLRMVCRKPRGGARRHGAAARTEKADRL